MQLEILSRKSEGSTSLEKKPCCVFLFVLFSFTCSEIHTTASKGIAFELCSGKKYKTKQTENRKGKNPKQTDEKERQKQAMGKASPNFSTKPHANLLAPAEAQGRLPALECHTLVQTRHSLCRGYTSFIMPTDIVGKINTVPSWRNEAVNTLITGKVLVCLVAKEKS